MINFKIKYLFVAVFTLSFNCFSAESTQTTTETENDQFLQEFCTKLINLNPDQNLSPEDLYEKTQENKIEILENDFFSSVINHFRPDVHFIIPNEIGRFTTLKELCIHRRKLGSIPTEIGSCIFLEVLDLKINDLSTIPTEIGRCQALEVLDLEKNELVFIPTEIGSCQSLQTLILDNNKLQSIPTEIGSCSSLESLILIENKLTSIPHEMTSCSKLKNIDLRNNPLSPLNIGPNEQIGLENVFGFQHLTIGGMKYETIEFLFAALHADKDIRKKEAKDQKLKKHILEQQSNFSINTSF